MNSSGGLSDFQLELAQIFFSLPESSGFLLAGGGALNALGLINRPTDDLDFFTQPGLGEVNVASRVFIAEIESRGMGVQLIHEGSGFVRFRVFGNQEDLLVDLAVDSPPSAPFTITFAGPTFSGLDIAVRKTLTLFGRAEARDFVDVYALHQHFDRNELLVRAGETDSGFDIKTFAHMLRSHQRLSDGSFPSIGVDLYDLRSYFDDWANELDGN